jgi:arylsulfatase A-like enzyme
VNGQQAIRMGKWKAVRLRPGEKIELYDLDNDISESKDLADKYPEIVAEMAELFRTGRTESEVFPLPKAKSS